MCKKDHRIKGNNAAAENYSLLKDGFIDVQHEFVPENCVIFLDDNMCKDPRDPLRVYMERLIMEGAKPIYFSDPMPADCIIFGDKFWRNDGGHMEDDSNRETEEG
jgi:hypothetical protein